MATQTWRAANVERLEDSSDRFRCIVGVSGPFLFVSVHAGGSVMSRSQRPADAQLTAASSLAGRRRPAEVEAPHAVTRTAEVLKLLLAGDHWFFQPFPPFREQSPTGASKHCDDTANGRGAGETRTRSRELWSITPQR